MDQLFNTSSHMNSEDFMRLWLEIRSSGLDSYQVIDNNFSCLVHEKEIANWDGNNLAIFASLEEDAKVIFIEELTRLGFLRPLQEEVVYYPVSRQIEAESYISQYSVSNEEHEVVNSLREMNLNEGMRAVAKRRNEFAYDITININQESSSMIKTKMISKPNIKTALVCLCFGLLASVEALAEERNKVMSLDFTTEREAQIIKYKNIIDKHIVENHKIDTNVANDTFGKPMVNMNRAATEGVKEILNKDFNFEQKLRGKLEQLEDKILGNSETTVVETQKKQTTTPSDSSTDGFKITTKNRILQGKAQIRAEYSDYVRMEVEANALAKDKIKANIKTKSISFKSLGVEVHGHFRYASSDQTVVTGIKSTVGENVNINIYNRLTQEKDEPASENVIEMRYQIDF